MNLAVPQKPTVHPHTAVSTRKVANQKLASDLCPKMQQEKYTVLIITDIMR